MERIQPLGRRRWYGCAALIVVVALLAGFAAQTATAGSPPHRLDDNRGNIGTVAAQVLIQAAINLVCPFPGLCDVDIGGRVQNHPNVFNVFWDGDWNANNPNSPSVSDINNFVSTITSGDYLSHATQYGVHPGSFSGSHEADNPICGGPPRGDVGFVSLLAFITCEVQLPGTGVPYPSDDTVYAIWLAEGATVSGAINASCGAGQAAAFHAWSAAFTFEFPEILGVPVPIPIPTIQGYPFTVVPATCALGMSGFPVKNPIDGFTELFAHELAEATIDPFPPTGWVDNSLIDIDHLADVFSEGEPADICSGVGSVPTTPVRMASNGFVVGTYWSNADGACVPQGAKFSLNETSLPGSVPHTATLDGNTVNLPFSDQLELGTSHTFSYPTPVNDPSPGTRWVTTDAGQTISLSGDFSDTASYTKEFLLTTGTDPGSLAPSDGTLTPSGWYADGSTAALTTDELIPPSASSDRYRFDHWGGSLSTTSRTTSIVMNSPKTATATYQLQHKVVLDQTGIDSGVTWHLPSVSAQPDGTNTNAAGPLTRWVDHGASITFSYESPVPGSVGTQYVLTGTSPTSPFTVNSATNIVGTYKTQYLLTVKTNGLLTNLTHIRNGTTGLGTATDATPLSVFLDKGTVLALDADANVDGLNGVQYFFQSFVPAPPGSLLAPFTTTAGYKTMEQLINDALASGGISGPGAAGVGNSLKQKFQAIQASMAPPPKYNAALGQITAFINEVDAQCCSPTSGKKISAPLAKTLKLDGLLVYRSALCKGIAAGQIGTVAASNSYTYYSGLVSGLGGVVLPPC